MQVTKENLTIIIVTIKSKDIIHNCLNSIEPDIKKIVIENSSDQKFIENLKNNYQNLECYLSGKNLGMGAGNNFGIKKSRTRYIMILNPDTVLKKNTLDEIFKISKNINFSIISPMSDNKEYPNYKTGFSKNQTTGDLIEVDRVDGYAMILDTTKFDDLFFDEKIFMYLENDDLCMRMKKKGEKIFVCKKSLITHLGAKTVDSQYSHEIELSRNWHWSWSKFYFRKKHYGYLNSLLLNIFPFLKSILKCFLYLLLCRKNKFKIYLQRASGFFHSALNKRSWYRPSLD